MRSMIVALAMCVGVAATAAAQDAKAKGEQLFADQKCTLCHSVGERGNKKGPLDGVASKASRRSNPRMDHRRQGHGRENEGDAEARDEGVLAAERRCGCARGLPELPQEVALKTGDFSAVRE